MSILMHFGAMVAGLLATASISAAAHAEPLRLSYFVWTGFGPLFVARDKGFFAEEGVEVQLINLEDHTSVMAGLGSGQIDAVAGALLDAVTFSEADEPLVCVLLTDVSRGGDGILAANDIQSVADLKGRSVAALSGGSQIFVLNVVLKEFGLTQADIELVDLSAEDAVEAFMLREVDAAVTYEPWLSEGQEAEHGHLLIDNSGGLGAVYSGLITPLRVFRKRESDFEALGRAWDAAVAYTRAHTEEAREIMMEGLGWREDPAVFVQMFDTLELFDGEANRRFFGTAERPGPVYDIAAEAVDVLSSIGEVKMDLSPGDVIAHGVWE